MTGSLRAAATAPLLLLLLLAASACSSKQKPPPQPPPKHPDTVEAARQMAARFLDPKADHRALTLALRPRDEDYARVFVGAAAALAKKGYHKLWVVAARQPIRPRAHHTRVDLYKVKSDAIKAGDEKALAHFPAGYRRIAHHLKPGLSIYRFRFVASGKQASLAFDGLYNIDGRWVLMPQPWRALDPPRHRRRRSH
ncbi:MAG: hypothetical protein KC503_22105 [Myxococcales bacterium]|nr:hypothetical protein [Myxococcales bacterium]